MAEALDKLAPIDGGKQAVPVDGGKRTAPAGGGKQEGLRKAEVPSDPFIRAENEDDDGYDPYSDRLPEPSLCSSEIRGPNASCALMRPASRRTPPVPMNAK